MLGIFDSESVRHLCDGRPGCKVAFRPLDNILTNVVARRISGRLFYHIAEIVGRYTEFVGAIL